MFIKLYNIPRYENAPTFFREDSLWQYINYPPSNWKIGNASGYLFKSNGKWYNSTRPAFALNGFRNLSIKFTFEPTFLQFNGKEVYESQDDGYTLYYIKNKYVITNGGLLPYEDYFFEDPASRYPGWCESDTLLGTYIGKQNKAGDTFLIELDTSDLYECPTLSGIYVNTTDPNSKLIIGVRQMKGDNGLIFTQTDDVSFSGLIQPYKTDFHRKNMNYIANRVYRGGSFSVGSIYPLDNSNGATLRVLSIYPLYTIPSLGAIKTFEIVNMGSGNHIGKEVYCYDAKFIVTNVSGSGGILNMVVKVDNLGGWECYDKLPYNPDDLPVVFTRYYIGPPPDPTPYNITVSFDKLLDFSEQQFYIAQIPLFYEGDRQ